MKRVNIKNSVMIAIMAIGMVMVSCGGGKQQSTATGETKTEAKTGSGIVWEDEK